MLCPRYSGPGTTCGLCGHKATTWIFQYMYIFSSFLSKGLHIGMVRVSHAVTDQLYPLRNLLIATTMSAVTQAIFAMKDVVFTAENKAPLAGEFDKFDIRRSLVSLLH